MVLRRPRRVAPAALVVGLMLGLLLVAVPGTVRTTGAVFTDTATTTTGELATGPFVPAPANALLCSTSGLTSANLRLTTGLVTAPPRGTAQYLLRIVRTDVTPPVRVYEAPMTVGASAATADLTGALLNLAGRSTFTATVTTRLAGQTAESSPARTRDFTYGALVLGSFGCGGGS